MKKNRLKKIFLIMMTAFVLLASGCSGESDDSGKATSESGIPEESMVYLYFPQDYKIMVKEDRYQLKQPDSISASIEEIMTAIAPFYEGKLIYDTYMLDSNNVVTLEFTIMFDYDVEYCLLAKAAIVRTLYQIADISEIRIIIYSDNDIVMSDDTLGRDSIYYYDEEYPIGD